MTYESTVTYVRLARPKDDGYKGLVYFHSWPTGHQYLVFNDAAHAQAFSDAETRDGRPTEAIH